MFDNSYSRGPSPTIPVNETSGPEGVSEAILTTLAPADLRWLVEPSHFTTKRTMATWRRLSEEKRTETLMLNQPRTKLLHGGRISGWGSLARQVVHLRCNFIRSRYTAADWCRGDKLDQTKWHLFRQAVPEMARVVRALQGIPAFTKVVIILSWTRFFGHGNAHAPIQRATHFLVSKLITWSRGFLSISMYFHGVPRSSHEWESVGVAIIIRVLFVFGRGCLLFDDFMFYPG